jgi:hypothetical protein
MGTVVARGGASAGKVDSNQVKGTKVAPAPPGRNVPFVPCFFGRVSSVRLDAKPHQ